MRERVREGEQAMSFGGVEQKVKVRADLQPEAKEQRIDQGVDHFYRSAEHILRGQLERAAHWKNVSYGTTSETAPTNKISWENTDNPGR